MFSLILLSCIFFFHFANKVFKFIDEIKHRSEGFRRFDDPRILTWENEMIPVVVLWMLYLVYILNIQQIKSFLYSIINFHFMI